MRQVLNTNPYEIVKVGSVGVRGRGVTLRDVLLVLQISARLRFSSGNSDVMVPAPGFSLSLELARILHCRYRV